MNEIAAAPHRATGWELARADLLRRKQYDLINFQDPLPNDGRWPDFMIIGAQKGGTTWAYRNLVYHPEIWMPLVKELHYFSLKYVPSLSGWERDFLNSQVIEARKALAVLDRQKNVMMRHRQCLFHLASLSVTDAWYRKIFSFGGSGQVVGEASTFSYILPRQAVAEIVSQNPRVRAILVLRDPIDRAWSHLRMQVERGDAYAASVARGDPESSFWPYIGPSNYPEVLKAWRGCLPTGQLLLLRFEDIAEQPLRVLRQICDFLHISFDPRFFTLAATRIHSGVARPIGDDLYRKMREEMEGIYDQLAEILPDIAAPWRARHYGAASITA